MQIIYETHTEESHYVFDDFLNIMYPVLTGLHFTFFDYNRINGRFEFKHVKLLILANLTLFIDLILNIVKVVVSVKNDKLQDAKQVGPVASIELMGLIRGFTLLLNHKKLVEMYNKLDGIFPSSQHLQRCVKVHKQAAELKNRFRFFYYLGSIGILSFITMPMLQFILRYRGGRVLDEYHQHVYWLPYEIKYDVYYYPWLYGLECYQSLCNIALITTWDHAITICVSQLRMHFDFLCDQLNGLDARDTLDPVKAPRFNAHINECIVYQQHINRLGREINSLFNISIFFSDMLIAATICFDIYLIVNATDILGRVLFVAPCLVMVWLNYDVSKQGTELITATGNIKTALYGHNWYDGSQYHKRKIVSWLQLENEPLRLTGFEIFEVNMEHFKEVMLLAYQMFAFLSRRSNE